LPRENRATSSVFHEEGILRSATYTAKMGDSGSELKDLGLLLVAIVVIVGIWAYQNILISKDRTYFTDITAEEESFMVINSTAGDPITAKGALTSRYAVSLCGHHSDETVQRISSDRRAVELARLRQNPGTPGSDNSEPSEEVAPVSEPISSTMLIAGSEARKSVVLLSDDTR
jgi:hypothetical protein